MKFGTEILKQADVLATFTEDAPQITRTYLSKEHKQAGEYLIGLMRDAGMTADFDPLGNIVGRYEAGVPFAPVVMTGSHQDSVRNAGRYDGLFGILSPIACVKELNRRGLRLPYTLEIVGFGDEEGVRFPATLIGSKAMAGVFDPEWLDKADANGVTMRQAINDFGGDAEKWRALDRRNGAPNSEHGEVIAFVESHIEQGPVLLNEGLAVGVVTAISAAAVSASCRAPIGTVPACPASPVTLMRKRVAPAMAVTTPTASPSFSSTGPCSMCDSTKATTSPSSLLGTPPRRSSSRHFSASPPKSLIA